MSMEYGTTNTSHKSYFGAKTILGNNNNNNKKSMM